jgi:hypothetical protein
MGFGASKPLRVEGPHGRFIRDSGGALACSITNAPPASHADAPFLFEDFGHFLVCTCENVTTLQQHRSFRSQHTNTYELSFPSRGAPS